MGAHAPRSIMDDGIRYTYRMWLEMFRGSGSLINGGTLGRWDAGTYNATSEILASILQILWYDFSSLHTIITLSYSKPNPIFPMSQTPKCCTLAVLPVHSLKVRRSQSLDHTCTFNESRPEYPVGILEHTIFQTDNDELRSLESCLDESANVLCV